MGNDNGKACSKQVRGNIYPILDQFSNNSQYGCGLNGGETAFGHLHTRMFLDSRLALGQSGALLFVDMSAAFASMLRSMVFDLNEGDEAWIKSLLKVGFSREDVEHIKQGVNETPWLHKNGKFDQGLTQAVSRDVAMAQSFFTHTWFSQEHIPNVVKINMGSSAGMPLADVIYSMAMSRVINKLDMALRAKGICMSCNINNQNVDFPIASFHDDLVVSIIAQAKDLVSMSTKAAETVFLVFSAHGMKVNFSPGKTEVLYTFHGEGAIKAKQDLALDGFVSQGKAGKHKFQLRFIRTYKHLGTSISASSDMAEEVTTRGQIMVQDSKKLRRNIYIKTPKFQ